MIIISSPLSLSLHTEGDKIDPSNPISVLRILFYLKMSEKRLHILELQYYLTSHNTTHGFQ